MRYHIARALPALFLLAAANCVSPTDSTSLSATASRASAVVGDVVVTLDARSISVGARVAAHATVYNAAGDPISRKVSWHTSDSSVVVVSQEGSVTATGPGTALVKAGVGGVTGRALITVVVLSLRPAVQPEPVYSPATDKLLVQDDFDSYTGITDGDSPFTHRYPVYRALGIDDNPVALSSVVTLPTGRGDVGHSLRLAYGGLAGASDIIVGTDSRLDQVGKWNGTLPEQAGPYTHFIFSTWIRFSPGADPAAYHASGVKGVMIWHNGNERYQAAPHRLMDYTGNTDWSDTRWDVGPPHPPNVTTHLNHWKTPNGEPPHFSAYTDGAWHRFTVEVYATEDPAGHRGERLWLDGVLMFDNVDNVGDLSWGTDYDYSHPVTHFMVFGNYVRGSIAALSPYFTVDFDDWSAWTN